MNRIAVDLDKIIHVTKGLSSEYVKKTDNPI